MAFTGGVGRYQIHALEHTLAQRFANVVLQPPVAGGEGVETRARFWLGGKSCTARESFARERSRENMHVSRSTAAWTPGLRGKRDGVRAGICLLRIATLELSSSSGSFILCRVLPAIFTAATMLSGTPLTVRPCAPCHCAGEHSCFRARTDECDRGLRSASLQGRGKGTLEDCGGGMGQGRYRG